MDVAGEIQRVAPRLYGYALARTGDPDLARELVQDCAVKAMAARNPPGDRNAMRAWLFRILRNAWIDGLRASRTEREGLREMRPEPPSAWRGDAEIVAGITVREAMRHLPPDARDILALVDIAGFRYAEAAELLGIPVGTVMSRLSRARRSLLDLISESKLRALRRARSGGSG